MANRQTTRWLRLKVSRLGNITLRFWRTSGRLVRSSTAVMVCVWEGQDSTNINNLVQSRESSQTAAQGGQEVSAANIKKILRFVSPPVLYRGLAVTELVFSALLCLCPSWPGRILRSWSRRQQRSSAPSLVTVTRDVNGEPVDKIYSPDFPNNSIGAVFLFPCLVKR